MTDRSYPTELDRALSCDAESRYGRVMAAARIEATGHAGMIPLRPMKSRRAELSIPSGIFMKK